MSKRSSAYPLILDISRLVWRVWRGRHPTGIDRVCLAYVEQFQDRALAVVQRKGFLLVLSQRQSKKLFKLLLRGREVSKRELVQALAAAILTGRRVPPAQGMLYLNVGHTGLNDRALADWVSRSETRAVHLIHDLIPITNPEFCRPGEAEKHRERIANALESASGIISNSRATLDELAGFAADRTVPMPQSVVAWIAGVDQSGDVQPKVLERPYFVAVGTIEARKNHLMLLQAWRLLVAELGDGAPILVIVGQAGWEAEETLGILDHPGILKGHVRQVEDCGDAELMNWIAGARALLMPSFAEGFGLPVVEALSLGTPVIASNLPVFREIAGGIPTYLSPSDGNAWGQAIRSFSGSSPERDRQLSAIGGYEAPTWSKHFEIVESWMSKL